MQHPYSKNISFDRQSHIGSVLVIALALMASSPSVFAAVTVQVCQAGSNVIFDASGTLNLTDLNDEGDGYLFDGVDIGEFVIGGTDNGCPECNSGFDRVDIYGANNEITPPANLPFTEVDNFFQTTTSEGGRFGIVPFRLPYSLNVPDLYGSEDPYSGSSTFTNETFASMGLMPARYTWTWGAGDNADSVTLAIVDPDDDQNGDCKSDIVLRNSSTGANQIYIMDGTTINFNLALSGVPNDWQLVGRGDYDGDTKSDLLWRHSPTDALWIYRMNGPTTVNSVFVTTVNDSNWKIVGNGDYNGDGHSDILWHHAINGTVWLYEMNSNAIINNTGIGVVPNIDWQIVGSGDYDGDGKSDIFWRNSVTGGTWMYLMDGATISTSMGVSTTVTSYEVVGNGDYNGDGKSDILWRNSVSGTNWIFLMNGPAIASNGWISALPDLNWKVVGDSDYNGDGRGDVLWRNMSTGSNFMYLMDGLSITTNTQISVVTDQNWQIANPN